MFWRSSVFSRDCSGRFRKQSRPSVKQLTSQDFESVFHLAGQDFFLGQSSPPSTGRHSDKKPSNMRQTLSFLSKNRAQTPKFLKPKIKKIFRDWRVGGGGAPPRGSCRLPFLNCKMSFHEIVFSGLRGSISRLSNDGSSPKISYQ